MRKFLRRGFRGRGGFVVKVLLSLALTYGILLMWLVNQAVYISREVSILLVVMGTAVVTAFIGFFGQNYMVNKPKNNS